MPKGQNYWQKRFQAVEAMNNAAAKETVRAVTPAFDQAQAQIEKEINAWYQRFAKNNQISLQEAKKLLTTRELKEFRWDVKEYIEHGRQNAVDQAWMKQLENASARFHISRLEALKIRTQNAAERAFGNELDQIDTMTARMYMDDYYHTAYEIQRGLGIGFDVAQIDQRKLDNILSKPWTADKMTFSDRIWKSKTQLIDSLHKELTQMCVLGKAPDQTIKNIANRMNVSKGQAGRLIMTEAAYFSSAAQKDCFNDLDVERYEIVATLDNRTSDVCQEMDGKVFDMKDFEAGVTAPPFHVWCRSCTAPWFEDNDDGMRAARDADSGKTYYVPADMKYPDWKATFVNGGSKTGLSEVVDISVLKDKIKGKETEVNDVRNQLKQYSDELINAKTDRMNYDSVKQFYSKYFDMTDDELTDLTKILSKREKELTEEMERLRTMMDAEDISDDEFNRLADLRRTARSKKREVLNEQNDIMDFNIRMEYYKGKDDSYFNNKIADLENKTKQSTKKIKDLQAEIEDLKKQAANYDIVEWAVGAKKKAMMTIEEAYEGANPFYDQDRAYKVNCQRCVQTYELRRRGYDVIAKPKPTKNNTISWGSECFTPTGKYKHGWEAFTLQQTEAAVKKMLKEAPDGSRYAIYVKWKKNVGGGAHVFIAEKNNGLIRYVDPQPGSNDVSHYFENGSKGRFGYFRLDDKEITMDPDIIAATVERVRR